MDNRVYSTGYNENPVDQRYRRIVNALDQLDTEIHDLDNITGLALEYFETFETGKDACGQLVCRMSYDQLNRFGFILRHAANRAHALHSNYLAAMTGCVESAA